MENKKGNVVVIDVSGPRPWNKSRKTRVFSALSWDGTLTRDEYLHLLRNQLMDIYEEEMKNYDKCAGSKEEK